MKACLVWELPAPCCEHVSRVVEDYLGPSGVTLPHRAVNGLPLHLTLVPPFKTSRAELQPAPVFPNPVPWTVDFANLGTFRNRGGVIYAPVFGGFPGDILPVVPTDPHLTLAKDISLFNLPLIYKGLARVFKVFGARTYGVTEFTWYVKRKEGVKWERYEG